ncbi:MAPEG family protein [Colwellia demingiae]|uniref:MAPEG family protein n=1 Tax=Colwellia demingiae TaxID=89401 RepID=A0A5C6QMB7_9GAMM|nr:MAPEG family protein [Colwellia demingiae]TWX69750.1 MAPEG family protein [Colwellia demingiae]
MTTLIICLFLALLLPLLAKAPVAYAMAKFGGYNNNHPREQQSKLTGFGARALAAHQNAFESVILFAPAIVLALATGNTHQAVIVLAIVHIISRVLYNIFYLLNIGLFRSIVWGVATLCSFAIVYQCIP